MITANRSCSIDDLVYRYPAAQSILEGYGIDTCCGGAESLAAAARDVGINVDRLLLEIAVADGRQRCHESA